MGRREEVVFWLELRGSQGMYLFSRCQSVCLCVDVSNPVEGLYKRVGSCGRVGEAHDGAGVGFGRVKVLLPFYRPTISPRSRCGWEAQWWVLRSFEAERLCETKGMLSAT